MGAEAQAAGWGGRSCRVLQGQQPLVQRGQAVSSPMDGFRSDFLFACALWGGVVSFGLFVEKNRTLHFGKLAS